MNSIQEKRTNTIHEKQFDKALQETKDQIEQICRGIEVKKHLGENSYNHYTYDKKYYIDEVIKYFEGKGYKVTRLKSGYAEMGIYTFEEYRNRGFAYALCLRTIQELEKKGIKPIWACDKANVESDRLAQRLGYVNPVEYEFVYLEPPK